MAKKKTIGLDGNAFCLMAGVKQITLKLVGLDGNAYCLMAEFQCQAKAEGWSDDEIKAVMDEAKSGNYDHLLATLSKHIKGGGWF